MKCRPTSLNRALALACCLACLSARLTAADYFVSQAGDDSNDGLAVQGAFRTIQKAVDVVQPGDTIHVRGDGPPYSGRISITGKMGSPAAPIILQTLDGDPDAIVDLTGMPVPASDQKEAILRIEDCHHVTVKRLVFRNYRTTGTKAQQYLQIPCGIYVNQTRRGTCSHIVLQSCTISGIWQNNTAAYDAHGNAHGIIVMGRSAATELSDVVVDSCDLYDLRLGSSEALALNGNVTRFRVSNNRIHDCSNIGIDFIGYEGACDDPAFDQARFGECTGNRVSGIDSATNPAYGGNTANLYASELARNQKRSAGGIYVDGGRSITIDSNEVTACNIGIEIASEKKGRKASDCIVTNNLVKGCHVGGVLLGGASTGNGGVDNIVVSHNTIYQNDATDFGGGQIKLANLVTACVITNNVVVALPAGSLQGGQYIVKSGTNGAGNVIDGNIYAGVPALNGVPVVGSEVGFTWNGSFKSTFSQWRSASGQDANSVFVNKLRIRATSGALPRFPKLLDR